MVINEEGNKFVPLDQVSHEKLSTALEDSVEYRRGIAERMKRKYDSIFVAFTIGMLHNILAFG